MKWVSKILINRGTVEGVNKFTLTYSPGSQEIYAEQYSTRTAIANQAPSVQYHEPTEGAAVPVSVKDQNKEIFLETAVMGASNNAIIASINALKRAIREATAGNGNAVEVSITPDGSSYTTYYKVLHGYVDDSRAYYEDTTDKVVKDIVVPLTCEPLGYGDSFTLSNYLTSSPHMIEDSDSNGLADGWTASGSPTLTIETSLYLIGGAGQKVAGSSAGDGVYSGQVSSTDNTAAYIWTRISTGTVIYKLRNVTDGSDITTKSLTSATIAAASDKTRTDNAGNTWYRLNLSGAAAGTKNVRIDTAASGGAATYFLDGAYLAASTTTAPVAFSSKRNIYNRYDPAVATTNINYLDTWGIPGDAPALLKFDLQPSTGKATQYIVGAYADGISHANDVDHYRDSSEFTSLSGTWTTGTGTINNHYFQCSTTGGVLAVAGSSEAQKISNIYARQPWRVFALAYTSSTAATIQMKYYSGSSTVAGVFVAQSEVGQLTETSKWQLVDLGTLNLVDVISEDVTFALSEEIHITQASSQTLRIDGIFYMPTQNGFNISRHYDLTSATSQSVLYDGASDQTYSFATGIRLNSIGRLPILSPGPIMNRLVFIVLDGSDNELDITAVFPVTLTVTPRTSHLLGVA